MGGSRSHSEKKSIVASSQNSPIPVLICWSRIPYVFCLLKVVSYYEFSVLSMSVMSFHKKNWIGVGVWGDLYPVLVLIF